MEENDELAEASLPESHQLMSESDYVGHPESLSALFFLKLLQTVDKSPMQLLARHLHRHKGLSRLLSCCCKCALRSITE